MKYLIIGYTEEGIAEYATNNSDRSEAILTANWLFDRNDVVSVHIVSDERDSKAEKVT